MLAVVAAPRGAIEMTFFFASLGRGTTGGWPVHLMYFTEAAFVTGALVCGFLAVHLKDIRTKFIRHVIAFVGGTCASFGLIMPFELAPFFFNARGEVMLASIGLNLLYPIVAIVFFLQYRNIIDYQGSRRAEQEPGRKV